MPACESKLVSRSSRKATVAKTVFFFLVRPRSCSRMPSLVGDRGQVLQAHKNRRLQQERVTPIEARRQGKLLNCFRILCSYTLLLKSPFLCALE